MKVQNKRPETLSMLLRQAGNSSVEANLAFHYGALTDTPVRAVSASDLCMHAEALGCGALPIGSIEYLRAAMQAFGLDEPSNLSYPDALRPYLRRDVRQRRAGSILDTVFVKPVRTKAFTGFVYSPLGDPDSLSEHDREQFDHFMALPADEIVWTSEPVSWVSEVRVYVVDEKILGEGRYDDGLDDAPLPEAEIVRAMVAEYAASPGAPRAFALDAGVLAGGETALVEVNDAWAIGYYRGTLSCRDYIHMLWARWSELVTALVR